VTATWRWLKFPAGSAAAAWSLWALATPVGLTLLLVLDHGLRHYPAASGQWLKSSDGPFVVAVVASSTVGVLVAWRRPRHPVGWLLLALGVLVVETGTVEHYIAFGLLAHRPTAGAAVLGALNNKQFVGWLAVTSFALLLTPSGRLPSPRWRRFAWAAGVFPAVAYVASVLHPGPLDPPFERTSNVLAVPALEGVTTVMRGVGFIGTSAAILICAASLIVRFRRARGDERQQLLWVAMGAGLTLVAVLIQTAIVALLPAPRRTVLAGSIAGVFLAAIPVTIGVAVLQYRLYELGTVIRRAATYAVLTALLVGTYLLTAVALGQAVGSPAPIAVVAIVAALAGGAAPRLQTELDRRFNRRRYHAIRQVEEFSRRSHDGASSEPVDAVLRRALGDPTLNLAYRLASREAWVDGDGQSVGRPREHDGRIVSDIHRDGQLIAAVDHSADTANGLFRAVLQSASGEIDNARLRAEVREQLTEVRASRARIVAAGDAERRRIERNLHDGAQQRLVAVALDLQAARLGSEKRASVSAALDQAVDDLGRAIKELRDLANGLHPSILGEEGLVAALEAVADHLPLQVRVDARPDRFPPEVEATAYYVACEALTNAAKHAGATSVEVRVSSSADSLLIEVRDDGVGGAAVAGGSGLRGLADRVDAVGGRFDLDSPPGRGTTVRVELPCGS
jgi:signal transduction histidine kinase